MPDWSPQQARLAELLLSLVPADGSTVGNTSLRREAEARLKAEGASLTEEDYWQVQGELIAQGLLVKGQGRGGSVRRPQPAVTATAARDLADGDDGFALQTQRAPVPVPASPSQGSTRLPAAAAPARSRTDEAPQIIAYRHPDRRANNPEVGMVTPLTDPEGGKQRWAYDPHLDPALQFDSQRGRVETLIDDALIDGATHAQWARNETLALIDHALAGPDAAAMRDVLGTLRARIDELLGPSPSLQALDELRQLQQPYLNWAGKAERTSFEVDTVSLHVHERIDPLSILSAVRKATRQEGRRQGAQKAVQPGLFDAPFENLPLRDAIDFYRHERGWANRLIAGDSLLVMNSLLQKESMAGRVQMIYLDPPYGIKYGSNFQPFVGKRDVKDRADADLTQEPEMIKAFRDTWELGIHSYLTYLRDRLLLAQELLSESGSVFVQISDENVHLARVILDEIFGPANFCSEIIYRKTAAVSSPDARVNVLATVADVLLWYAKDRKRVKYRQLYLPKSQQSDAAGVYVRVEEPDGRRRRMSKEERGGAAVDGRIFRIDNATSTGSSEGLSLDIELSGARFTCGLNKHWKTTLAGMSRLGICKRIEPSGTTVGYVRFIDDFPAYPLVNVWQDTGTGSFTDEKVYVVQTGAKAVERCVLMTTDPGDLVLDPTCGSGTTAYVAEKWGRRWITCDTSRVAVTLAKQRLMTASYDYFELKYPHEGLKGGFIYKTVPHVTLKSIANNPEIDAIQARMHPAIEAALQDLNAALMKHPPEEAFTVYEGVRKGEALALGADDVALLEWEVPFDFPAAWAAAVRPAFDSFHAARQAMQRQMDDSIAAHADQETLYDQPAIAKSKLRIAGPFTVEAVPFPSVKSLDEASGPQEADASIARTGESGRQHQWRDELLKTGIRGKGGQMLKFADLEALPTDVNLRNLHASGHLDSGERVVVSFGPEHAALEQRQVANALNEAGSLFPLPKMIVFCAFTFDPEAAKDIDGIRGITALKAQMNTDLLTEDLKKARASNQSFWLMGQPEVEIRRRKDGQYEVEVHGFDYFDTVKGELVSGGKSKIAMWSLDTDYDERSLFPRQVFFPMAGKGEGWEKLKKDIRAELDEALLSAFHGSVSLPFEAGENRKIAVKIVDDRGIESLKVMALD